MTQYLYRIDDSTNGPICPDDPSLLRDLKMSYLLAQTFISRLYHAFKRQEKPVFLGAAACEAGISLRRAVLLAQTLEENGWIKLLSGDVISYVVCDD